MYHRSYDLILSLRTSTSPMVVVISQLGILILYHCALFQEWLLIHGVRYWGQETCWFVTSCCRCWGLMVINVLIISSWRCSAYHHILNFQFLYMTMARCSIGSFFRPSKRWWNVCFGNSLLSPSYTVGIKKAEPELKLIEVSGCANSSNSWFKPNKYKPPPPYIYLVSVINGTYLTTRTPQYVSMWFLPLQSPQCL